MIMHMVRQSHEKYKSMDGLQAGDPVKAAQCAN